MECLVSASLSLRAALSAACCPRARPAGVTTHSQPATTYVKRLLTTGLLLAATGSFQHSAVSGQLSVPDVSFRFLLMLSLGLPACISRLGRCRLMADG